MPFDYYSPEYPQRLTQNQYYFDGNNVIQEREIYQGATVSNTYYHSLPSSLNRVISIRKGGIDYWYHTDPIGKVLFISDSTGSIIATYNQEAFGNIISSTGYADNDLHLHERGQEDGYIDLYYFGARWYDPELGRWLSPEPLGLDGPNLYQFCFNDPVNGYDPNGLLTIPFYGWVNAGENAANNAQDIYANMVTDPNSNLFEKSVGWAGGLFSSLWTTQELDFGIMKMCTSDVTFLTLEVGGAIGVSGPKGSFFGRSNPAGKDMGYRKTPGIFNRGDKLRIGWSWNAKEGRNMFSIHGGKPRTLGHWHIDIFKGPDGPLW